MAELLREGTNFPKIISNKRVQALAGGTNFGTDENFCTQ